MWLIVFMVAVVLPLIIWGFVAGWYEKTKNADTETANTV